jgi:hypothetical protein
MIENQGIEIHIILHSLDEAREELRKSLKRGKEIAIVENDTQYKEIDSTKLFANGESNTHRHSKIGYCYIKLPIDTHILALFRKILIILMHLVCYVCLCIIYLV